MEQKQPSLRVALWLLVAAIVYAVVAPADDTPTKPKDNSALRIVQTERLVKENLLDPKSARFPNTYYKNGTVCGTVIAKNAFGANVHQLFLSTGGRPMFDNEPGFTVTWERHC